MVYFIFQVERKRARNRVAASKCRMRKLERIAVLDDQAKQLRAENDELIAFSERLKEQLYKLKQELRWHLNNGCKIGASANGTESKSPDSTTNKVTQLVSGKEGSSENSVLLTSDASNANSLTPMGS